MTKPIIVQGIRNHPSHGQLTASTEAVHISYHPSHWLIKLILERAPNVEHISISHAEEKKLYETSRRLLKNHGIILKINRIFGYERKKRGPIFFERKHFLDTVTGPSLRRLKNLLAIGHRGTKVLLHFYGARGYEEKFQVKMTAEYGYQRKNHLSDDMNGVLHFLNPKIAVGKRAQEIARVLPKKIKRELARQRETKNELELKSLLKELSKRPPRNLPPHHLPSIQIIGRAKQNGLLSRLRAVSPEYYGLITTRFGLHPERRARLHTIKELTAEWQTTCPKMSAALDAALRFLSGEEKTTQSFSTLGERRQLPNPPIDKPSTLTAK